MTKIEVPDKIHINNRHAIRLAVARLSGFIDFQETDRGLLIGRRAGEQHQPIPQYMDSFFGMAYCWTLDTENTIILRSIRYDIVHIGQFAECIIRSKSSGAVLGEAKIRKEEGFDPAAHALCVAHLRANGVEVLEDNE